MAGADSSSTSADDQTTRTRGLGEQMVNYAILTLYQVTSFMTFQREATGATYGRSPIGLKSMFFAEYIA